MSQNQLGKLYRDGDVVVRIGDKGTCMFQIQKGELEVIIDEDENMVVNTLSSGDFFGEMSLFTGECRSATVRSKGESRVLTIDEPAFLRRLQEDPVLGFRVLETMFSWLRHMNSLGVGYEGYNISVDHEPSMAERI